MASSRSRARTTAAISARVVMTLQKRRTMVRSKGRPAIALPAYREAGANVIVTACPFCLVNIQDAIKVAGMEGKMEALDFTELIEQHLK